MKEFGFFLTKMNTDILMHRIGNLYEFIVAVDVDDVSTALMDPNAFVDVLENKHMFKTKGTGKISFHFGIDLYNDKDNPF